MIKLKTPAHTVTAEYRITTPMFIGDHLQEAHTITPAAFKGALRFWWRAIVWQDHRASHASDDDALASLHNSESSIFGSIVKGQSCQSKITLKVKTKGRLKTLAKGTVHPEFKKFTAARYLGLGSSLMTAFYSRNTNSEAATLMRSCISPNQSFTVTISSQHVIDTSVIRALKLIGLIGGLGSRTRRGIGSITIQSISQDGELTDLRAKNLTDYEQLLKSSIGIADLKNVPNIPPYSAFSPHTRIDYLFSSDQWIKALDNIGGTLVLYRSWGKNSSVTTTNNKNVRHQKRFEDDHNWFRGGPVREGFNHPDRVIFGLPLGFDKHTTIKSSHLRETDYLHNRRASPLLFHVHEVGGKCVVISTLLKSDFLPDTSGLVSTNERKRLAEQPVLHSADWTLLTEFLDGDATQTEKRFPVRKAIFP